MTNLGKGNHMKGNDACTGFHIMLLGLARSFHLKRQTIPVITIVDIK